jgi:Immunity protein 35
MNIIDFNDARKIALDHINANYQKPIIDEDEIAIVDDLVIEKEWGWIFIYQSKRWISNRNRSYKILGLCPIVVEKLDGNLRYLDEGNSAEECIQKYENRRGLNQIAVD